MVLQPRLNGQLNEQPLAELVREVVFQGGSGALRLQHEQGKAVVYLDAGQIIYAASNLRELRIGEYLKKEGLVSEKQLATLGNDRSDLSLVSALCANNTIDREKIAPLISKQVADLLRVALLWTKGTWEFDDRTHLGDPVRVSVDTHGLLIQSARKMGLEFVASRFRDRDELISPVAELPDFSRLLPAEGFVLSRVESSIKVRELITLSGLPELEASRTIYGLALGGFIQREHWQSALYLEPAKALGSAEHVSLPDTGGPVEPLSDQGEISGQSAEDELDEFFARLDSATNHYEVLNVSPTAAAYQIKSSYYALARRYHPDRFHLQASTALHARVESVFARIAQAYEVLMDSALRTGYDARLAAQKKIRQFAQPPRKLKTSESDGVSPGAGDGRASSGESDRERCEMSFREGFTALQQGQTKLAITNLAAAARGRPQESRYRAYYGCALAALKETRRLAEKELLAAIKLDPANSSYRIMLAELYCDLGLFRRAQGELERATFAAPNDPGAIKVRRRLEAARTAR